MRASITMSQLWRSVRFVVTFARASFAARSACVMLPFFRARPYFVVSFSGTAGTNFAIGTCATTS